LRATNLAFSIIKKPNYEADADTVSGPLQKKIFEQTDAAQDLLIIYQLHKAVSLTPGQKSLL
jgi:hypothetical protein